MCAYSIWLGLPLRQYQSLVCTSVFSMLILLHLSLEMTLTANMMYSLLACVLACFHAAI